LSAVGLLVILVEVMGAGLVMRKVVSYIGYNGELLGLYSSGCGLNSIHV
jgi:phenylalanyl-tRNA synthetase alpha subunit